MLDAVGERAAQFGSGFQEHADRLADQDRAGLVAVAQVMQPSPDLWRHHQGVTHNGVIIPLGGGRILPMHNSAIQWRGSAGSRARACAAHRLASTSSQVPRRSKL